MKEFIEAVRVLGLTRVLFYRTLYRPLMRVMHRFHLHYAPPSFPEGDTMLWCQWCGMRDVVKRRSARLISASDFGATTEKVK